MKEILIKALIMLILIIFIYVLIAFLLYSFQSKIIFHPEANKPNISVIQEKIKHIKEVTYLLPNGKEIYAWYLKPKKNKKLIVFFHGNTGNLLNNTNQLHFFNELGYGVLMPEYEGFGGIKGNLTQKELEQDAKTALLFALSKGYNEKDIIIYGHSLGTYVATYAANFMAQEKKPVHALVLETPFYSILDMAKNRFGNIFPYSILLKDKFETDKLITNIQTKLYIGHGKNDTVVPYSQGLKLYEKAPHPKVFFSDDTADHHQLPKNGFIHAVLDDKE
ncbi:MAG: alpha/beta hydrolase [Alphaproteobacteria bacterium]|nr:alpha/beta hydrolase [Alphaproteobacteria bacterium]